jgi:hypothetical protein
MTDAADLTDHWPLRGDPARLTAAAALLRASDAEQIFGTRFPGEFVLAGVARLLEAVAHDLHRHVDLGEAVVSAASEVAEHVLAYVPRSGAQPWEERRMHDDQVDAHLKSMNDLDFVGWNNADWNGVFARQHTDDVFVDFKGQAPTRGIRQHIEAMQAYVESVGGAPPRVAGHPIAFGAGEWTCVVGEFEGGGRMVTVAKWRDGAISEEYIWV